MLLDDVLKVLEEYANESQWKRTFSREHSLNSIQDILESKNRDFIILTEKNEIAALAVVSSFNDFVEEKYGTLDIFYVRKPFRQTRLGRILATQCVEWFETQRCDKIFTTALGKIGQDKLFINLLKKFQFKEFGITLVRE